MDSLPQTQSFSSVSPKTKVIIVLILIIVVISSVILYKKYTLKQSEDFQQKLVDDVASSAAKVNLSDEEKATIIKNLQSEPSVKLSDEEAAKRQAEIIKATNSTQ